MCPSRQYREWKIVHFYTIIAGSIVVLLLLLKGNSMKTTVINTLNAPQPIGPYSQAIKAQGSLLFMSGQIALTADGTLLNGSVQEQTHQVIANMKAVLAEANAQLSHIVKTTVFLKDMNDFATMNEVYSLYFNESKPARSTVEVSRLPKDVLVEIEAIAIVEND